MKDDKRKKLEANTKNLLELLGEDPSREGLLNTPKRVAKAWEFLTKGYNQNLDELINNAIFEGKLHYEIKKEKCTECKGHYDEPQCIKFCPVDCIIID